jgi:PD-(D/E)XK nuclease superfamily
MGIALKKRFVNDEKASTLAIGILGHEILSLYYDGLKMGLSLNEAKQNCRDTLSQFMLKADEFNRETVLRTLQILERYWSFYEKIDLEKYEILEVEKEYNLPLTDDFSYVFRFDLLLKERGTPKIGLVDHKFKYDFFSQEAINLTGQMPKYLGALRYNGIFPSFVFLNQIRSRPPTGSWTNQDFFKRSSVDPSNAKVSNAVREQVIASQEIAEFRELPFEVRKATALRSMDSFPNPCGKCPYNLICRMEYDGGNATHVIANDFGPNSYNYNKNEVL